MSHFYSLDDDDERGTANTAVGGPSRLAFGNAQAANGSEPVASESSPFGPTRRRPSRNGGRRTDNPIQAILETDPSERQRSVLESVDGDDDFTTRGSVIVSNLADSDARRRSTRQQPPVVELRLAWTNERAAPTILAWAGDAVDGVCSQIEEQMQIVDSLAADSTTGEEEHVRLALVELDVERARWLLRSYLRCRLAKIERFATFIIDDAASKAALSELERGYAAKYAQIYARHFHSTVLDFLPENMRSLDDRAAAASAAGSNAAGRSDMVARPDLDLPVFVRCLQDCGTFRFPGAESLVEFKKGSIHFVRFRAIHHLIAPAKVELL